MAGLAGHWIWLSFACAFFVAILTGVTYAELISRIPKAGGEPIFVYKAFKAKFLSTLIGYFVLMSAIVSVSTISHIFSGYSVDLLNLTSATSFMIVQALYLIFIAGITLIGIRASSYGNIIFTLVEMLGLAIVIVSGLTAARFSAAFSTQNFPGVGSGDGVIVGISLILNAAVLAFFSFIGFEDMENLAEETLEPRKNVPRAIFYSLSIAFVFYLGTALVAAGSAEPDQLARSGAPLSLVVGQNWPWFPTSPFNVIALFAIVNTGLMNFIMGSRLLYGMAEEQLAPKLFSYVSPRQKSPQWSILFILGVSLIFCLILSKEVLAGTTSLALMFVFLFMHMSLLKLKSKSSSRYFTTPTWIQYLAIVSIVGLALFSNAKAITSFVVIGLALSALILMFNRVSR